jgi:hypothetical protein
MAVLRRRGWNLDQDVSPHFAVLFGEVASNSGELGANRVCGGLEPSSIDTTPFRDLFRARKTAIGHRLTSRCVCCTSH